MDALFAVKYSWLIPLLPLFGAMISGFFGAKWLKGQSHWPIWLGVGASGIISLTLLFGTIGLMHAPPTSPLAADGATLSAVKDWYTWIEAGGFVAKAGFFFDPLTCVMLTVVTVIGFFITVFAAGYMKGEEGYFRFFAYLGLFIFAMTCLVMGSNFIMLYLGWEGVGLCSYLLIGYYYDKPSAREAAKKAFLVNRVGDFGFGLGIMMIFKVFHSVSYFGDGYGTGTGVFEMARAALADPSHHLAQINALKYIPFLLMVGAFGKSAQFPLYVWLPDAMEGPTPVSALIHAATMVTAGVYMIARCGVLFVSNDGAMWTIACIGTFTAIFAATIALRQFDLKKVFAYSTVSQLGYMFAGVGCFAPVAGVFHLVTHACFKALLFLSSGVVMHAMAGELDMRKMSGLKRVLPWTHRFILIGCLALAGCPFLSGFFSKDEIIGAVFKESAGLGIVLLLAAFLTAYYTFRLYFRVFQGPLVIPPPPPGAHGHGHDDAHGHDDSHGHDAHGHADPTKPDQDHVPAGGGHEHNHEPLVMMLPLAVLTIGAILAGYLNWPKEYLADFLSASPSISAAMAMHIEPVAAEHALFTPVMGLSAMIAIAGILLAFYLHLKNRSAGEQLAITLGPITRILEAKYWVDEIYQALIVEPLREIGSVLFGIDRIIDAMVDLLGFIPQLGGFILKLAIQRGFLQGYAAVMALGIAAILLLMFIH